MGGHGVCPPWAQPKDPESNRDVSRATFSRGR